MMHARLVTGSRAGKWIACAVALAGTFVAGQRFGPLNRAADRRARAAEGDARHWRDVAVKAAVDHANADVAKAEAARADATKARTMAGNTVVLDAPHDSVDIQFGAQIWRVPSALAQIISRLERSNGEKVSALLAARESLATRGTR